MEREQGLFSAYFNAGQDALRGKLNDCRDLTEVWRTRCGCSGIPCSTILPIR